MKTAFAILGGAALSALATTVVLWLVSLATNAARSPDALTAFAAWGALAFAATALMSSSVGLAWHAFARARGWSNVHAYWLAGLVAGLVLAVIVMLLTTFRAEILPRGSWPAWGALSAYGAMLGGFAGFFAWLIRRPDRDAPNPPTPTP